MADPSPGDRTTRFLIARHGDRAAMPSAPAKRAADATGIRRLLCGVGLTALAVNCFSLAASHLWIYPDSIDYIQLAGGIVGGPDLPGEFISQVRPPGYPMLLAGCFRLFGSHAPAAILVLQHAMVIATVVLTAAIAWQLTSRKSVTVIVGLLCACSLQMLAYANLVLTETPFTLILVACVYFLIRYQRVGWWRYLALASVLAGACYLLRSVGLYLFAVCPAAALLRVWSEARALRHAAEPASQTRVPWLSLFLRRSPVGLAVALVPALLVVTPWMVAYTAQHESLYAARHLDYMLYLRPVLYEGLDSTQSEAMADIHRVFEEGKADGKLPPDADFRCLEMVTLAYRVVRGESFERSSAIVGQAARDLILENPGVIALGTLKHAAWILLNPDAVYRFQPGGAPGRQGKRDTRADIYDIGTYEVGPRSWEFVLRDHRRYLPLETKPRAATPFYTAVARWFHEHIENGAPLIGLRDSLYEELVLICVLGGMLSLLIENRTSWAVVAMVVVLHVLVVSFIGGPHTRHAMPVKPLLLLYAGLLIATVLRVICEALGRLFHRSHHVAFGVSGNHENGL
ncbi:MAG: glycosyltransferase family 39 protein [Phycisphaerae bacterium]|nr:glycosyltransferase family 39 protein [Phycisphaerae bacterium]